MENVYLATLRRSRIDGSEVTQAIGVFSTPEYARTALDEAVTEFYDYSVIHVSEEENGFIFYFVRHEDLMGADVCTGKITEMEVGCTYFNNYDHL